MPPFVKIPKVPLVRYISPVCEMVLTNPFTAETGRGCTLTAIGTTADFADPNKVTADLAKAFTGWTEQPRNGDKIPTSAVAFLARVLPHRPMVTNAAGPFKSLMRFTSQINSLGKMRMIYNAAISRKTRLKALRHRKNVMIRTSMITRSTQPMVNVKLVGTPD